MRKIKLKKQQFILYLFIFILFLILAQIRDSYISPFSFGVLFALMWTGAKLSTISFEYLLSELLTMTKLEDLYCAIATVFILILVYMIHKKIKKPMNVWLVGVYALISQVISLYYIYNNCGLVDAVVYTIIGIGFLYVDICIFQVAVLRKDCLKLTLDEKVCLICLIIALGMGCAFINVDNFSFYKLLATVLILLSVSAGKKNYTCVLAIAFGCGVGISLSNIEIVGELAVISMFVCMYNYPHKYKISAVTLVGSSLVQLYFIGFNIDLAYALLPYLVAVLIYLMLPNKFFNKLTDRLNTNLTDFSAKNIINSTRKTLKRRMSELSDIFAQMKQIHLQLLKQELEPEQVVSLLSNDLCKSLCSECKYKNGCYKGLGLEQVPSVNRLISLALQKGKVSILDIPTNMAQKCNIINLVIGQINQNTSQYKNYESMTKDVNNVKFLLAEQMGAISQLMLDLGEELNQNISVEEGIEAKLVNKMLSNNIVCSEVFVYTEITSDITVVTIVKGENAYNPLLEKIVGSVLNVPVKVTNVSPTEVSDYYSVTFSRSSKRDVVFGISSRTKSGSTSSGDSHTLIRLGNNKYLLALCDGMGSGENARKMSALTIGLIENFYKAGFDDEFILTNVNKLLSVNNQESFSTLDLCVLDLTKESIDFIKIGAPYGIIKRDGVVEKVENGTLPLGILKQVKPNISRFAITCKDMIVMMTDGITDAFSCYDELAQFVNQIVSTNPQVVAQTILDEAVTRNNMSANDDMTVLVARTFLKG